MFKKINIFVASTLLALNSANSFPLGVGSGGTPLEKSRTMYLTARKVI